MKKGGKTTSHKKQKQKERLAENASTSALE
jgi:hypothetical protein